MSRPAATERAGADIPAIVSPGFVGRERELDALTAALAGPAALVLVEGEAGIGKSRMLAEYLASRPGPAGRILVAGCPPLRQPLMLGP